MASAIVMRAGASKMSPLYGRILLPPTPRGSAARYAFAVIVSLITFAIRASLEPLLLHHSPLLLFTLPVAVTAICAGSGPALLAAGLGVFLGSHFFFPYGIFGVYPDHVRIGMVETAIFLTASVLVAKVGGELRLRRWHAEKRRSTSGEPWPNGTPRWRGSRC